MKESEYQNHMITDPTWRKNNIKQISLIDINDDITSQVRQAGVVSSHVRAVAGSISREGQQIPVTLELITEKGKSCHTYRLVDGNHRFLAVKHINESRPEDQRILTVDAIIKVFNSEAERLEYQALANAGGLPVLQSTINDALGVLKKMLDSNSLDQPNIKSPVYKPVMEIRSTANNKKSLSTRVKNKWDSNMKKVITSYYPHFTEKEVNKVINKFADKLPCDYYNYTYDTIRGGFKEWAVKANEVIEKKGAKKGEYVECQQQSWRPSNKGHVVSSTFLNKSGNPKDKQVVTVWCNNPSGYNDARLDLERIKMVQAIESQCNSSSILKKNVQLVDEIYIAPQKKTKGCLENGWFKVSKKSNGTFDTDSIPTAGWSTKKK
jgi:hypothetical protein